MVVTHQEKRVFVLQEMMTLYNYYLQPKRIQYECSRSAAAILHASIGIGLARMTIALSIQRVLDPEDLLACVLRDTTKGSKQPVKLGQKSGKSPIFYLLIYKSMSAAHLRIFSLESYYERVGIAWRSRWFWLDRRTLCI